MKSISRFTNISSGVNFNSSHISVSVNFVSNSSSVLSTFFRSKSYSSRVNTSLIYASLILLNLSFCFLVVLVPEEIDHNENQEL